ncbi:response regulator [Halothece sp. PCC 7418]|uniref:response regulator n=1 Tax=Halothece sp. (strain PCC 7418) TaxID=65093 RepID=UPI0002FA1E8A|nr:response regulator [Halothece sp. PCC 7418]
MPVQTRDEATSSRQNSLILVIDDNASDLQLLSRVLQKVNYQVLTASSGTEGLQIAKTSKPHLILLDLMMPNMDGLQVCQHLKADADLQQIPVIFLTASWEDQQLEQAFQVGAADYVTKPLKKIELLARINVHLELQQKQRLLETALKAKSQLMANLSHEIRTSLNAILGMSQFLLTTSLTTKQEKCLNLINKSGNHLLSIVNDILDFSKLEAQKRTLELHQFHLRQLIADTVRLYEVEAANQNVVLKAQVDPDLAQFFMGDSFQIRQVIYNLLSNALKFTEEGQVELRVFSLAKTTSEGLPWALQKVPLRFEIQDTGPGIAPEHQDKLFQSFYQADTSTGGTGLGLAICKQIVELMGGTIGVESQRGQGSTFWFEIDLDPCYNFQIPELIGKRLLLVTQTCSEMQAVIQQTEAWGMTVTQVETLKIGSTEISRGFLESQPYDFVLFNLAHFRRETDLQTIEQVCQELHSTQTKIIGLESQDKKHHRQQQLAFDSFLSDPLQSSQLLSCFQEFLAQLQPRFEERQLGNLLDEVTVLVVEDSVVNQQVLERHLEGLGGAADYVNHGAEALNSLQQKQYDLLLMDCKMPTLDGYETTRQIRALSIKQPIIIGLTAYKGEAEQEKSLAAGMDDCLSKPIRFERFAQLLAKWLLGDFDHWADEIAVSSSPPQNAENLSKTERWIDDEVLQELTEGDLELRQQLVGLYINQARDYLKQGQQAVADQDAIALGHCAHQLEGSSVNTGMNLAVNLAIRLDQSAQQANFQKATEILKQLEQVIEQVEQEILH